MEKAEQIAIVESAHQVLYSGGQSYKNMQFSSYFCNKKCILHLNLFLFDKTVLRNDSDTNMISSRIV